MPRAFHTPAVSLVRRNPWLRRETLRLALALCLAAPWLLSATEMKTQPAKASIVKSSFGQTPDGEAVHQYTLTNAKGSVVKILDFGGMITEVHVPDRNGKPGDVVLGFTNLAPYIERYSSFGAFIGRFANRIAKGQFTLDGKTYTLAVNNGPNHLHGGKKGFNKIVLKAEMQELKNGVALKLSHTSPDGDEGYPGTLRVSVTYTFTDDNELRMDYEATTDKATPINLTNHAYWNLSTNGNILGHELMLAAKSYTPSDDTLIPTGEIKAVKGTPFDFTTPKLIGRDIEQITNTAAKGYDHNFVLDNGGKLALAARVYDPNSGRVMEVLTDQPGVQLYTANFVNNTPGKLGQVYEKHSALCLETQHFPDSVNHPNFPSAILRPGEVFRSTTIHRFSVK